MPPCGLQDCPLHSPLVHVVLGVVQPHADLDRVALPDPLENVLHPAALAAASLQSLSKFTLFLKHYFFLADLCCASLHYIVDPPSRPCLFLRMMEANKQAECTQKSWAASVRPTCAIAPTRPGWLAGRPTRTTPGTEFAKLKRPLAAVSIGTRSAGDLGSRIGRSPLPPRFRKASKGYFRDIRPQFSVTDCTGGACDVVCCCCSPSSFSLAVDRIRKRCSPAHFARLPSPLNPSDSERTPITLNIDAQTKLTFKGRKRSVEQLMISTTLNVSTFSEIALNSVANTRQTSVELSIYNQTENCQPSATVWLALSSAQWARVANVHLGAVGGTDVIITVARFTLHRQRTRELGTWELVFVFFIILRLLADRTYFNSQKPSTYYIILKVARGGEIDSSFEKVAVHITL